MQVICVYVLQHLSATPQPVITRHFSTFSSQNNSKQPIIPIYTTHHSSSLHKTSDFLGAKNLQNHRLTSIFATKNGDNTSVYGLWNNRLNINGGAKPRNWQIGRRGTTLSLFASTSDLQSNTRRNILSTDNNQTTLYLIIMKSKPCRPYLPRWTAKSAATSPLNYFPNKRLSHSPSCINLHFRFNVLSLQQNKPDRANRPSPWENSYTYWPALQWQ